MKHEKFHYKSVQEIQEKAKELSLHLPFATDTAVLKKSLHVSDSVTLANRLGIAPMEGADSELDGSPSELTTIRYVNEAIGGSAIIWFEAVSIVPEARSSSHQLMITPDNLNSYKELIRKIKEAGMKANGFEPFVVLQANHSGRYSNPMDKAAPLIAYRHPIYEKLRPADDSCIVSDDYLKNLESEFGKAAKLTKEAGFDAIDIKSCHGYLLAELLSAYKRPGIYGGPFENRSRLLFNCISAAKAYEDAHFMVTVRLDIYDGFAYPYGFGVKENGDDTPCFDEPIALVNKLYHTSGIHMVNLTMGNPYVSIHVTRPFDIGKYVPTEHPLVGEARMINGIGAVKKAVPEMKILASAPSYLRQFSDLFSAGAVEEGLCDGMLFGRMSFANPAFPNQIIKTGRIDASRVCLTCGKCGNLIRAKKPTGCVIRNPKMYLGYYKEFLAENK